MNRTTVILGFAALAFVPPSVQAAGPAFIRPTLAYVAPEADGYDDAPYIGVQAGVFAGATKQHEFSGEIGATGWDSDERVGTTRIEASETYVPVLANYRYYLQPEGSRVRFFFGPSIGVTHVTYEVELSGPNVFGKDDSFETFLTVAGNAGVDIKVNERLSLNVGYRYLYIDGGETELFGAELDLDASKAHVIFAGLNIRF